jgi:hypothetical protein
MQSSANGTDDFQESDDDGGQELSAAMLLATSNGIFHSRNTIFWDSNKLKGEFLPRR